MDNKDLEEEIFNISEVRYGQDYKRHLLEQYKIYIESAEKISDRRQKTNDFFLAINSALLALFGYFSIRIEDKPILIILMASILGICICYFWYRIIKSYKDMNSGKFKVIHIIEKNYHLLCMMQNGAFWEEGKTQNSIFHSRILK